MLKRAATLFILLAALLVLTGSLALSTDSYKDAAITDYGLGDTYHPGDTATGYIVVANSGSGVIHNVAVTMTVYPDTLIGFPAVYETRTFKVDIKPGDSRRVEYSREIPDTLQGISTLGHYRLETTVKADGHVVKTFSNSVTIV